PCPAADHLHPVRRRSAPRLIAYAAQCLGERCDPVPADFVGIGKTAAYEMRVAVVEARDEGAAARVDHARLRSAVALHLALGAQRNDAVSPDGNRLRVRLPRIESGDAA